MALQSPPTWWTNTKRRPPCLDLFLLAAWTQEGPTTRPCLRRSVELAGLGTSAREAPQRRGSGPRPALTDTPLSRRCRLLFPIPIPNHGALTAQALRKEGLACQVRGSACWPLRRVAAHLITGLPPAEPARFQGVPEPHDIGSNPSSEGEGTALCPLGPPQSLS